MPQDLWSTILSSDWTQFIPDIVSTSLGAAFGLIVALYVERRVRRYSDLAARRLELAQKQELRARVIEELERAAESINEMSKDAAAARQLSMRITIDIWRSASVELIGLLKAGRVPAAYDKFYEANRLADLYTELAREPSSVHYLEMELRPRLQDSLSQAADLALAAASELGSDSEVALVKP